MDNQKDNSIVPTNKNQNLVSDKNVDMLSYFDKSSVFVFVYKKTEKLATALYMVTNLFSDNEPMKWTLRKKVADLLSFIVGYKNISTSGQFDFSHEARTKVLEIVSLLEIASRSGLVSSMNFSILHKEFQNLISALDTTEKAPSESLQDVIPKTFFDVTNSPKNTNTSNYSNEASYSIKDKKTVYESTNVPNKNNRQVLILQMLGKKSNLTIKDIAQTVKNCSEKTIQRELISLIKQGLVKKEGERRWSKYSLI